MSQKINYLDNNSTIEKFIATSISEQVEALLRAHKLIGFRQKILRMFVDQLL